MRATISLQVKLVAPEILIAAFALVDMILRVVKKVQFLIVRVR
jgi:hypothetical protein